MTAPVHDLVLRQGRLAQRGTHETPVADLAIDAGRIVAIAPTLAVGGKREIDCRGKLVSPPLVESHLHLDSVYTDDGRVHGPASNRSGTLFEGIALWADWKTSISRDDVIARGTRAVETLGRLGVLHVRTHADVSEPTLTLLDGLLEVRERVRSFGRVQVVAFPQDGLFSTPDGLDRLHEAIRRGVDVVGGIPHGELTRELGVRSVHESFDLAMRHDRLIDLHCDEVDDPQSRFVEVMAARCITDGIGPRVTASHTTAMGSYDAGYATKLMGRLRQSRMNFVANPLINIHLQGRGDGYPRRRGITRVRELLEAGLNVSLGHDCIQDPWYPLGTGNLLDVAHMAAHVCHLMTLEDVGRCYDMITWGGAATLSLGDRYGLHAGADADVIVFDAPGKFEAIRTRMPPRHVIARGRLIEA
jgi:cytosine deaminase